jgi:hypothetical protein
MAFMAENPPEVGELFFGRSGGDEPVANYVARLDGTQYWQLSGPIVILDGYEVGLTFVNTESGSNSYLLCANDDLSTGVFTSSSSGFLLTTGTPMTLDVDGNGSEVVTYDGNIHEVTVDVFGAGAFQKLCTRFSEERMLIGWIKNLVVRDTLGNVVNEIPLTNKSQGATQIATVGAVNATMVGYNADVWELV